MESTKSMDEINALAENQVHDARYLKRVTQMGDVSPVVANRDIHSATGIKLVKTGMHINSSLYDRLLHHKLAPPLDQCLSTENPVTGELIAEQAAQILKEDKRLASVQSIQFAGWTLPFALKQVVLNPAITFKLTVMRETHPELFQHSLYVAIVSTYLGMQLRLDKYQLVNLASAALLHDIGILHIDSKLLGRGYKMSEVERRHLYAHPVTAWMILKAYSEYTPEILNAVLQHHERLDGSGYPRGLKFGEIDELGQIIAVAEIVASRFGGEEYGWHRLETILKLNTRRYGWDMVRHLKVFYQDEKEIPSFSETDILPLLEKMARISAVFASGKSAMEKCDTHNAPCAYINARLMNLKMEVIDAGLNPDAGDENFHGIEEDPQACLDAGILLDETLWQLRDILQEIKRRWPAINAEEAEQELDPVRVWVQEVEILL